MLQVPQTQGFCLIEILVALMLSATIIFCLLFYQFQNSKALAAVKFKIMALSLLTNASEELLAGNIVTIQNFNTTAQALLPDGSGDVILTESGFQLQLKWDNTLAAGFNYLAMTINCDIP